MNTPNIPQMIRQAIAQKGIPDKEFAEICGITPATLSRYLNGHRHPSGRILERMWPHIHPPETQVQEGGQGVS